jgi:hypothetical protein
VSGWVFFVAMFASGIATAKLLVPELELPLSLPERSFSSGFWSVSSLLGNNSELCNFEQVACLHFPEA